VFRRIHHLGLVLVWESFAPFLYYFQAAKDSPTVLYLEAIELISLYISSRAGRPLTRLRKLLFRLRFKMPHHARRHMCLSTKEHENQVLDVSKHYFGCLRDSERHHFYNRLPERSQRRIRREARRIAQLRTKLECQSESKAGVLLKGFKEAISDWRGVHRWTSVEGKSTFRLPNDLDNSADSEIKASMIFFKDSRPYDIPGVENTFPNQKIPIKKLLADEPDANPLMRPCDDSMIRYFHLPANNMIWVEVSLC
jgi:hypothetical protein